MTQRAQIRERPILFSGAMVRAILEGRKTQTRRVVKAIGPDTRYVMTTGEIGLPAGVWREDGWLLPDIGPKFKCPYGVPGDRLWVREEHYRFGHWEPVQGVRTKGGRQKWKFVADTTEVLFDAPPSFRRGRHHKDPEIKAWHKRLGRFMPKSLARTWLEITGVRVERLQDISEADALAEGFYTETCRDVFAAIKGSVEAKAVCWLEDSRRELIETEYGLCLCESCAELLAQKHDGAEVRGGALIPEESDGPAFCGKCFAPLCMSLTEYGIDSQLRLTEEEKTDRPYWAISSAEEACINYEICDGLGGLREKHLGRLAQIGFASLWDSINSKRAPWNSNPWVWVVTFKRLEGEQHGVAVSRE